MQHNVIYIILLYLNKINSFIRYCASILLLCWIIVTKPRSDKIKNSIECAFLTDQCAVK